MTNKEMHAMIKEIFGVFRKYRCTFGESKQAIDGVSKILKGANYYKWNNTVHIRFVEAFAESVPDFTRWG